MQWRQLTVALAAAAAVAYQNSASPAPVSAAGVAGTTIGRGPAGTMGGGQYLLIAGGGTITADADFNFNAVETGNGSAEGHFFQSFIFQNELVEFRGQVTCVAVDSVNRRAWVGGVVTENNSTHPSFTTPRTQPGRDVWFRVLDSGEGAEAPPDRTTTPGFAGDRGIITSAEYCAVKPWVDANTHAVTRGNIQIRP